jgi:hypothetical protein
MKSRLWKSVFTALVISLVAFPIIQKAVADCDMWAWITTDAANLSTNGKKAFKESVKWYRWISKGLDGDAICDDGWSVWGHSTEQSLIDFRRSGAPYVRQVYDSNWNNQRDGLDFDWAPNIPESGSAYHLDFTMSHSRAAGSNVNYGDPHPFIYQFGGRSLAMQHNGLLLSSYLPAMQILIGAGFWNMSVFADRQYNGLHLPSPLNDSELYAMLLMKNVLLADNYGEDDLWAIRKTINQIIGSVSYSSLNIYFNNGEEIYAASKSSNSTYAADHKIWYAYNNASDRHYACIVTGNRTPGYSPTAWSYWTPATQVPNGYWYKIDRGLLYPENGSLDPVTDPTVCEYAYNGRNPMVGSDASVAAGPRKDYVVVWGTDDGNIYYNYFDQMGLCERVPVQLNPSGPNFEYRNPDVVFDGSASTSSYYDHFYVVYERGPSGQGSNEIYLLEMSYNSTSKTWTPGTPTVVNQNNSEVGNPAVAWGGGKLVVTWQQTLPGAADWHIRTAAYLSGGSACMSDRIVGEATLTEQRIHPDALYVGNQNNGEPIFVVSYLQKDLAGGSQGVYVGRIITNPAPSSFAGNMAYSIAENPDHSMPSLALANETTANRLVCAFRESPTTSSHQIVALRIASPLPENYPSNWYEPLETAATAFNSFTPPQAIDPDFFEIGIASRQNGYVDVVFTDYDNSSSPAEYLIKCIEYARPFSAGFDTVQIDADASTEDMNPAVAIADWQGALQRLIVWDGYIASLGETRLTANFDPPHFGGVLIDGLVQIGKIPTRAEPVSGYVFNPIYPNPFNAAATLTFTLPEASQVELEVFDILGRNVGTLVAPPLPNGIMSAGTHSVSFNGSRLSSGVYLARLQAGNWSAVQKLVLIK